MNKKPGMYLFILWLWLLSILYFDFKLLALLIVPEGLIARFSVILFVICLNILWFYGIYHIIVPIYSILERKGWEHTKLSPLSNHPAVAILYTTKNDFQIEAVESCLGQDYPNYHVFICDDSTEPEAIKEIDQFQKGHTGCLTVIRRKGHSGYKAGNINHTLRHIQHQYPYFAINDADGILPPNFLSGLMPYFSKDKEIAFVQARQGLNPRQKTQFGRDLSSNINIHWDYYVPAKERYGFTMFYGHGAVIRTDVWKELGGMPEVATEDLSFSMKIRKLGYYGLLAPEITSYEEYPQTYERFRRRNEKWVKGTTECLFKDYLGFLFNPGISWVEKLDVFISAFSLLIAVPFIIFLLLVSAVFPLFYNRFRFSGPLVITPIYAADSLLTYLMGIKYDAYWTWDLFWVMVLMIFGPQFAPVLALYRNPKRMFRYIALSTFLYLSIIVTSNINLFTYLLTGKAYFPVTGEEKEYKGKLCFLRANSRVVGLFELYLGMILLTYTIRNTNIWLFSVAISLILAPLIGSRFWDIKWARQLLYLPFIVTIAVVILITYSLAGAN